MVTIFVNFWMKLFFVLTPFFALTMFLSFTEKRTDAERRKLAVSVSVAVALICLLLFFVGRQIFSIFGITPDSFRIGAGILLLLSGIGLVHGKGSIAVSGDEDVAVVPLAVPIIVGPATMGTILVMGTEMNNISAKIVGCLAMIAAVASVGAILLAGSFIQSILGNRGIAILSKLTGLILSAIAAQMIMTGVQAFLNFSTGQ
ncbi:MAG: MarC family protein [Lentisphaerae bacterium]|nr:MarC family protein [Lentisphaerota bacterium]